VKYIKSLVSIVVSAGLGLAGCASIDELKGTVSTWFSDATDRVPPGKILSADANRASKSKDQQDQQARKPQQRQTVERPHKPPVSVPAETVTPQRADAQFAPPQPAPVRLDTPWPQAPAPGTFSR
jgi:hypothetical protein